MPIRIERISDLLRAAQDYAQAVERILETLQAYAELEPESPSLAQLRVLRAESLLLEPIASARVLERETERLKASRSENQRRRRRRAEQRARESFGEDDSKFEF